jgi:hypothetical protein
VRVYRLLFPGVDEAIVLAFDPVTFDPVGWTLQDRARDAASIVELSRRLRAELMVDDVECLVTASVPKEIGERLIRATKANSAHRPHGPSRSAA